MAFQKICGCKNHEVFSESSDSEPKLMSVKGKKIRVSIISKLREEGLLTIHAKYICDACVSYAEKHLLGTEKRKKDTLVAELISRIEEGDVSDDDLESIMTAIGRHQSKAILEDTLLVGQIHRNDNALKTFNPSNFILGRNKPLRGFLKGVQGNGSSASDTAVANAVEAVYYLRNKNFIGPLSFSKSLLVYSKTGSKDGVNIVSACSPGGSYSSVLNWLNDHSQQKIKFPRESDVISFFDNNQVIGRKWRVKNDFKSCSSVTTSVAHLDVESNLQTRKELSPSVWQRFDSQSKKESVRKIKTQESLFEKTFDEIRNKFMQERLDTIARQQRISGNNYTDHIDDGKGNILGETPEANERYNFLESKHKGERTKVVVGEPILENPCSYDAVEKVLDHFLLEGDVGGARQWAVIGCDGLPYVLSSRIIEDIYICPTCKRQYNGEDEFAYHANTTGHVTETEEGRKYRNILMLTGHGHFEINMTKALFKLLWDIGLVDLAKMLGFRSPKALATCQSASDHHKSWQILEIFFYAMSAELMVPYVRDALKHQRRPNIADFVSSLTTPNEKSILKIIFSFSLALHVFRAGIRRNNSEAILASRAAFSPLFFGLNMPFNISTSNLG